MIVNCAGSVRFPALLAFLFHGSDKIPVASGLRQDRVRFASAVLEDPDRCSVPVIEPVDVPANREAPVGKLPKAL